jgi:hypothetical protein
MKLQTLQEMKKPTSAPKRRDYHSSRVTKDQPFPMVENLPARHGRTSRKFISDFLLMWCAKFKAMLETWCRDKAGGFSIAVQIRMS